MTFDLQELIAPIAADSPTGDSLRYDNTYQHIAEARREDDPTLPQGNWKRPLKRADWVQVDKLCTEALALKSKDIQIAGWLTEAWLHLHGLEGLARGLGLIESLCINYWDAIHPQLEEGETEYRIAPFVWMNDKLSLALRLTVPIVEGAAELGKSRLTLADWDEALRLENMIRKDARIAETAEQGRKVTRAAFMTSVALTPAAFFRELLRRVALCIDGVAALEKLMYDKLRDDSPGLTHIRKELEAIEKTVRELGGELAPSQMEIESKRQAGHGADIDQPPVPAKTEGKAVAEERSTEDQSQPNAGPIRSREEAYRRLAEAADYLRRTEPHGPLP